MSDEEQSKNNLAAASCLPVCSGGGEGQKPRPKPAGFLFGLGASRSPLDKRSPRSRADAGARGHERYAALAAHALKISPSIGARMWRSSRPTPRFVPTGGAPNTLGGWSRLGGPLAVVLLRLRRQIGIKVQ